MQFSPTTLAIDVNTIPRECPVQDDWLAFNRQLDREAAGLPNEASLTRHLETALTTETIVERVRWLTIARITELALKLAGDYADAGAFQAAGDLLVNPRRIDVYQRGTALPMPKIRHGALSVQFADAIGDDNPVAWMNRHLLLHIQTAALLPQLNRMLKSSGCMAGDYVSKIEARLRRIAETIAFLSAWQIADGEDLQRRMAAADNEDRKMIAQNQCRFTLDEFAEIGDDIENWILGGKRHSRFLKGRAPEKIRPPFGR